MKKSAAADAFLAHALECLRPFGPVEAKRMFGGWGLYREDVFFALVLRETLYLKTDEGNRADFDARGLEPFTFEKGGKTVVTSYRMVPEEALEDPRAMVTWAKRAYAAALRARTGRAASRRRSAPPRPRTRPSARASATRPRRRKASRRS